MSLAHEHRVMIERRGRSHKCVCSCGWTGHAWNELRPAEADAWHHVYGDEVIVDISSIPDERSPAGGGRGGPQSTYGGAAGGDRSRAVEQLVRQARELADRPSPYTKDSAPELWRLSGNDRVLVQAAVAELVELLARHDRRSAGAADSEWLQLITAKRLLTDALAQGDEPVRGVPGRALI